MTPQPVKRDWTRYSRSNRKRRKLEIAADGCHTIDEYFHIMNELELIIRENEELRSKLSESLKSKHEDFSDLTTGKGLSKMLQYLLECAKANASKKPGGIRYSNTIKELGLLLFILAGQMLYAFLASNLPLPSLSSVRRMLESAPAITEGVFRFSELKQFLVQRNLPLKVFVSSDGTTLNGRIQYDSKNNQIVGFALPLDKNGVPIPFSFPATSAAKISEYFDTCQVSSDAYCIMAQPLGINAPSFCLALFGTNNKFSANDVSKRWDWMLNEARKQGISIIGFSSDGDPRLLKPMVFRTLSGKSNWTWFNAGFKPDCVFFQDTIHLVVKLKSRLLKASIILPFGKKHVASRGHIVDLINKCSKDLTELTMSNINPKDKMNYKSAEKMCKEKVTSLLLEQVPGSLATSTYLTLMRKIMTSFQDPALTPLERIELIWECVFFFRELRRWIQTTDGYTLSNNFITSNAYSCLEVNAHSLIQIIQILRDEENHELFLPWLFSSQCCEQIFRSLRLSSTIKTSMPTFSSLDMTHRMRRIDVLSELYCKLQDTFIFPSAKKAAAKVAECPSNVTLPEDFEIEAAVMNAFAKAQDLCNKFGLLMKRPPPLALSATSLKDIFVDEEDIDGIDEELTVTDESEDIINEEDGEHDDTGEALVEDLYVASTGSMSLKTFDDVNVSPTSPFLKVKDGDNATKIIRKSSFVWLLSSVIRN